jgi:transforming growth factor-beta-induced protein
MQRVRRRTRDRRHPGWAIVAVAAIVSVAAGACSKGTEEPGAYPKGTIAAILAADDRFDTLMTILEEDAPRVFLASFSSTGTEARKIDVTWFAPTDRAFAAVPQDTLAYLLDDGHVGDLQSVLDHHASFTAYTLEALTSRVESGDAELETIGGGPIRLTLVDGVLHVDQASVIDGDVEATNGVIHVIDAVMIPDSASIT